MTIRLRLTFWYTALLGSTLILFSIIVYSALATNLRVQAQEQAMQQADEVARAVSQQIEYDLLSNPDLIQLPSVDFFADSYGIQIIGLEGEIYQRSQNLGPFGIDHYTQALGAIREGQTHQFYTTVEGDFPALVYSTPLKINNQTIGAVQIILLMGSVNNTLNQVGRYLILGTALSLAIAAIIGAFLARRGLAPIDTITSIATEITHTQDLGQRLDVPEDFSEVGRLAATFNAMLNQIQQLFQSQEQLVGDVSHELRTPLTTIQGNTELLRRMIEAKLSSGTEDDVLIQLLRETLSEVESETDRMGKMISDLLLLAQADSGALQLQREPVEMDTLLLEVYRQTRRVAELRKGPGALQVRLGSEDQALVHGDYDRLRQMFLNLAENAIKYTPAGGTITLGLKNQAEWVQIYVQDDGIGISAEEQDKIFSRFYRTDKARSRELGGSGLGLGIVQWIAQAHDGKITVESEAQVGSTFTVWLPRLEKNGDS